MKAYGAQNDNTGYGTVVFAETRGQAKSLLIQTDTFEGWDYTEIRPYRIKELDNAYRGETEMEWWNDLDRLALVKVGWSCGEDSFDSGDCECCIARDFCWKYEDYLEDVENGWYD